MFAANFRELVLTGIIQLFIVKGNALLNVDPGFLRNNIANVVQQDLHHDEMQEYYNNRSYTKSQIDGGDLLIDLERALREKFARRIDVLKGLSDVIATGEASRKECCRLAIGDVAEHPSFMQNVTVDRACLRVSSNAAQNPRQITTAFDDQCFANLEQDPSLKWQYFGSEDGVTTQVPGPYVAPNECGNYENRFRPWYVEASNPTPKQIVIVLDRSVTMDSQIGTTNRIEVAKQVATILIDSLNPRDTFAVIGFSDEVIRGAGCFRDNLALAIPNNKRAQSDFVRDIRTAGSSQYEVGISAAFSFFDATRQASNTERVVVFVSDGTPFSNCPQVIQTLQQENARLNNSVIVMTFGIGDGPDLQILDLMSGQSGTDECVVPPLPTPLPTQNALSGRYFQIVNTNNIRNQLTSYYGFFRTGTNVQDPVWTVPYLDSWGLGVVMTAALPVFINSQFGGVVALDMTLNELLEESTFLRPSESSSAFVVDESGLVINHPLFPYVNDLDSLIVEATAFERDPEFESIFESLKAGESGQKSFMATRYFADGNDTRYGVRAVDVQSTYYWRQIIGTPFRLCVVVATEEQRNTAPQLTPSPPFVYNRLDIKPPENGCAYKQQYFCTIDHSTVALSPRSFTRAEEYVLMTETEEWVQELTDYMEGRSNSLTNLKEGARNGVTLTKHAETLWTSSPMDDYILFRYIATQEGVFRGYPGCILPKGYDANIRPWYDHAVANRNKFAVTPPYLDLDTKELVVTLSKVLFGSSQQEDIVGVMGVDLSMSYFGDAISTIYPGCLKIETSCLLIDKAGFIVWSDDVARTRPSYLVHITTEEEEISNVLIQRGILKIERCATIEDGKYHRTYKISSDISFTGKTFTGTDGQCFDFSLKSVPDTNIYLLVRDANSSPIGCPTGLSSCSCSASVPGDEIGTCSSADVTSCLCPCKSTNPNYDPCTNSYNNSDTNVIQPCVPKSIRILGGSEEDVPLQSLPVCFAVDDRGNVALIVGLVVGGVFFIVIVALCIFGARKVRISKKIETPPTPRKVEEPPHKTHVETVSGSDYEEAEVQEYTNPYLDIVN